VRTLEVGYRVPRQIYELAARLLPLAAPGLTPLTVVRDGPAAPGIHRVDAADRPGRAVAIAAEHAAAGRFVGLICPPSCRQELADALAANGVEWSGAEQGGPSTAVNLVAPSEAKGLEFDAVVVIEPEEIVAADERGHRMLFIALTRTTQYLDIVAVGEPMPLAARPVIPEQRRPSDPPAAVDAGQLDQLAQHLAAFIAGGAPAPAWDEVLNRAATILERQAGPAASESGASGRHRRD
jgi:hypothetical protein